VLNGEKILITGATGLVGLAVATHLAAANEVWGVARFADPAMRAGEYQPTARGRDELESAGVVTRAIDIASGDFSSLPTDFTYVLHLAWWRAGMDQLDQAIRTNVEGPGLLLAHCRKAKAALVMSGMGVYTGSADPWHAYTETDPIGRGATAYAATSPACKLGIEAVARTCARALDLRVVIARLNTLMGPHGSFPGQHISAVLDNRQLSAPHDPNPHSPIHIDDVKTQLEAMLDAASTPAFIVNWCGDEVVTAQEWVSTAGRRAGRSAALGVRAPDPGSPAGTVADPHKRLSITGPCQSRFWPSFDRLYEEITATNGASVNRR